LIDLRSDLAEIETKIENNPKHAQLASNLSGAKIWAAAMKRLFR
jgi:hypothetical protein